MHTLVLWHWKEAQNLPAPQLHFRYLWLYLPIQDLCF